LISWIVWRVNNITWEGTTRCRQPVRKTNHQIMLICMLGVAYNCDDVRLVCRRQSWHAFCALAAGPCARMNGEKKDQAHNISVLSLTLFPYLCLFCFRNLSKTRNHPQRPYSDEAAINRVPCGQIGTSLSDAAAASYPNVIPVAGCSYVSINQSVARSIDIDLGECSPQPFLVSVPNSIRFGHGMGAGEWHHGEGSVFRVVPPISLDRQGRGRDSVSSRNLARAVLAVPSCAFPVRRASLDRPRANLAGGALMRNLTPGGDHP
jgi:hypothetical protein